MKIDILETVKNYENEPLKDEKQNPVVWRTVVFNALNSLIPGETMTAESKEECYQIINKCYSSKEVDLTVDQLAFILERIGKTYSALVYGRAKEFFNGEVNENKPEVLYN